MPRLVGTLFVSTGTINFVTEMTRAEVETEVFGTYPDVPDSTSVAHLKGIDDAGIPVDIFFVRGHIQGVVFKDQSAVMQLVPKPRLE